MKGKRANLVGKQWENSIFTTSSYQFIKIVRIPDSCRQVGPKKLIRVRSPFDFILVKDKKTIFLDAKSFASQSIPYSWITEHQTNGLKTLSDEGITSGYLILYRKTNQVVFHKAIDLWNVRPGESIKADQGIQLGVYPDYNLKILFDISN